MTHYFLDSSALIKRYLPEQGTQWVRALFRSDNRILIAQITPVEVVSGLMRRMREGDIALPHARAIRIHLHRQALPTMVIVGSNPDLLTLAADLLEKHPLRAYDAVQLASALTSSARILAAKLSPLVFVSADKRLLNIAILEGLTTEDPNRHL